MKREYGLDQITHDERSVVTVGTFDGVHRGHQAIVRYLVERAHEQGGQSVVVSFDPHPRAVVQGEEVPLLTTPEERAELLEGLGLDRFIVIPFTRDFSNLSAEAYVEKILIERIGLKEIVIGYDHRFGSDRKGDPELLRRMGAQRGFTVDVISPQEVEGYGVVSSSAIRRALREEGDPQRAARMLGRPYRLQGTVVRGSGRGKEIGFPTANIEPDDARKLVPRRGVYAVRVRVERDGGGYDGMMNIGQRPTFDGTGLHLEVHLLAFEDDLYGEKLRVEFVQRLRNEQKFASVEALKEQLLKDRERCRSALESLS